MSGGDAEVELRVLGGEPPPPLQGTARATRTAREQQNETFNERFQQENRPGSGAPAGQHCRLSFIREQETHRAPPLTADRLRLGEGDSIARKPVGHRFTSSLFFRLSSSLNLGNPELKKNSNTCIHSLSETQSAKTEKGCICLVNEQKSPTDTSVKVASDTPLFENIPAKKKKENNTVDCNGEYGPHEPRGLFILPYGSQSGTETRSVELQENIKYRTESGKTRTMPSSTVVTVLAPHWSGRIKRFEGNGNLEAQDVTNTAANRTNLHLQETMDMSLPEGSRRQSRVPFLGTRWNTVGCSTTTAPASLDDESKRKIIQTAFLDLNSGKMVNKNRDAGASNPVTPTVSPVSPLSLNQTEQRRNTQTGLQEGISSLSLKPTTSSLLLSLRRSNANSRNANQTSTRSELKHLPLSSESKPLLSPSSISYRTTETGPIYSPSSSNHRERIIFETRFFSASPTNKDTSFTQQPQTTISACSVSPPIHSPYDHSPLLKTYSAASRTTLTSMSCRKQVSPEGSTLMLSGTANIKDKPNTSPNHKHDLAFPSMTDNRRFDSQMSNNNSINNEAVSRLDSNMNLVMKTQGGSHKLIQRKTKDSPDYESDRLVKQLYDSSVNITEPPKTHSIPGFSCSSKISRAAPQTIRSHPVDLTKCNASNSSFRAKTNLSPSFPNPKCSTTSTDSSSEDRNNNCSSKSHNPPTSSQNMDTQSFTKPSLSIVNTYIMTTPALTSKPAPNLPLSPNTKTSSSFSSDPVASQTNIHASSFTVFSPQTHNFTKTSNISLIGFERSDASIPNPFHRKTVSSLIPTVSLYSKTHYNSASTVSTTTAAATTVMSPTFLTPPATVSSLKTITSSLLTPPATPITTSPNYSDTSSPKEGRTFSSSQERHTKRQQEGKLGRRVTWKDSVSVPNSETVTVEKPGQFQELKTPSPSRSSPSITTPHIVSFQKSSRNTSPICSPSLKTSSILVGKEGKHRSLLSDSADLLSRQRERTEQNSSDCLISDRRTQELTKPRQAKTLSVESGTVNCHSSAPLSLPPDVSHGYNLRYSSPPYSALRSSRSTKGETRTITPRSRLLCQPSQSNSSSNFPIHSEPAEVKALPRSKPPLSQNKTAIQQNSSCGVSVTDSLTNNHSKNKSQLCQNGQMLLISNSVNFSPQSPHGGNAQGSFSPVVNDTLVYRFTSDIAAPKNTTLRPQQHTENTLVSVENNCQRSLTVHSKEAAGHSDKGFSGGSLTESQPPDDESNDRKTKNNNEQNHKRSMFALKNSVSTPNSILSRSESDRAKKGNNSVFNRLRQKFSTRWSDDDMSLPWKWKRASQTTSVGESSDINSVIDNTVEGTKTVEKQEQEKRVVLKGNEKETEATNRWSQNRYTLKSPSASGSRNAVDKFLIWSDKSTPESEQDEQNTCAKHKSINKMHSTHHPTTEQFEFHKDSGADSKPTNQFLSHTDPSPPLGPKASAAYSKSPPSPRRPFSISPLDVTDDSVFYSPKLQHRRESVSPREPREGFSLASSRRSRASTGPSGIAPGQEMECLSSSYADLKYGIEPGRSFSVSSVLSSRPSGPGRISTGSRVMSVGNLYETASTCGSNGHNLDHSTTKCDYPPNKDFQMFCYPNDPGKMRSRSLPRSLTRYLANWSSGVPASTAANTTTSKPAFPFNPNVSTCHFTWDIDGPLTPPPTPPLSPVTRRISRPTSLSSPIFPSPSGTPQQVDSQSSRGHLPSRGYVSSLSTFDESLDSSSETTTDDEYYLERAEDKETEL